MQADKKKLAIVGALAVVVLCIGVFQFTGGGSAPNTAPANKAHASSFKSRKSNVNPAALANAQNVGQHSTDPTLATPDDKVAMAVPSEQDYSERDPFDGAKYLPPDDSKKASKGLPKFTAGSSKGTSVPPVMPEMDKSGLPTLGGAIKMPGLEKPKDTFDYSVTGVVTGDRPAAIFQDGKGNQRLIQLGSSLDPDTKVVAISRGIVTVEHHGKNMTMTVGTQNPTEKRSDEK